jgi:hypothetical protein
VKVYFTKYALTGGISEHEGIIMPNEPSMFAPDKKPLDYRIYFHKPDWHETWEGAFARAEGMRQAKIVSLEKQLQALRKLEFKKPLDL